uniref:Uncharacterized protein n=1 Tax=Pseudomonas phage RVTF4 TaxID=3236931 RepID=A0AB39CD16_9VIRU
MGLLSTLVKVGLVAAGTIVVQRIIDRTSVTGIYTDLDALTERVRNKVGRVGTVKANVRVESRELVAAYEKNITFVSALDEFRKNVEIYIESIPD